MWTDPHSRAGQFAPYIVGKDMKATLATHEEIEGAKRKLAWFALEGRGLYFDVGGMFMGTHTSYHVDGNIFRTSPASRGRPRFQGNMLPLSDFVGWAQLGIVVLQKQDLSQLPPLKARHARRGNFVAEVAVEGFSASTLNVVIELVHRDHRSLLDELGLEPPAGAIQCSLPLGHIEAVLTVIGDDSDLLVRPMADGFKVSHFNHRFTANAQDVEYTYEAYG